MAAQHSSSRNTAHDRRRSRLGRLPHAIRKSRDSDYRMTTIATDGKSMAGDSLSSANGMVKAWRRKIHRAPDGRIFGCCGLSTEALKFTRYMLDGGERPILSDDFAALVLNIDGTVHWLDKELEPLNQNLPAAIGSGCELAQGAMLAGKTPREAVEIACIVDRNSGGDIHAETL